MEIIRRFLLGCIFLSAFTVKTSYSKAITDDDELIDDEPIDFSGSGDHQFFPKQKDDPCRHVRNNYNKAMQHKEFEYSRALSDLDQNLDQISQKDQRIRELEKELEQRAKDLEVLRTKVNICQATPAPNSQNPVNKLNPQPSPTHFSRDKSKRLLAIQKNFLTKKFNLALTACEQSKTDITNKVIEKTRLSEELQKTISKMDITLKSHISQIENLEKQNQEKDKTLEKCRNQAQNCHEAFQAVETKGLLCRNELSKCKSDVSKKETVISQLEKMVTRKKAENKNLLEKTKNLERLESISKKFDRAKKKLRSGNSQVICFSSKFSF